MNIQTFTLEKYKGTSTRHTCPGCGKAKSFVRYIDQSSGQYLHPQVGRCNREIKCGYHFTPKQYFEAHNISFKAPLDVLKPPITPKSQPTSYIAPDLLQKSLRGYEANHFVQFLSGVLPAATVEQLCQQYFIGTSKKWPGATVFWQIDTQGKIRAGKVILYEVQTGKRVKEPANHIDWVHSILALKGFHLVQCLFGEHLLSANPHKPVGLVESEKTAIIATSQFPELVWLATGGLSQLNTEKMKVLSRRKVIMYPDLDGFQKWQAKAHELQRAGLEVRVSAYLNEIASPEDVGQGLDLADFLLRDLRLSQGNPLEGLLQQRQAYSYQEIMQICLQQPPTLLAQGFLEETGNGYYHLMDTTPF